MATILINDEDPQVCNVLDHTLGHEAHRVLNALNGNEGINCYRNHLPELILLDILMPEKEGLEMILDLQREFPDV